MNKIKFCPLTRKNCKEHKCGWYDEFVEKCGVLEMADALGWLCSRAEDRGINVNVISIGDDEQ